MTEWAVAAAALCVLVYAFGSRYLERTPITAAIYFTGAGLLLGPALGIIDFEVRSEQVKLLTEATLVLVLFSDASRISVSALRADLGTPGRLLGIGLPLTIVAGSIVGALVLPGISWIEATVLAIMVACTDAALGQAVVSDKRIPGGIRQALNVESGLNDGLCVPLFFIALAVAAVEEEGEGAKGAIELVLEEIGYGALAGVAAGALGALVLRQAARRGLADAGWLRLGMAAAAVLAAGIATPLGGSMFIAAFVGGLTFGAFRRGNGEEVSGFVDEAGEALAGITFLVFGAVILGPALDDLTWEIALYAALSLTVVRMLPVAIALLGTGARLPTVAFMGWFGPRGVASIVFGVLLIEESHLPGQQVIVLATIFTIAFSVLTHGVSALPLTARYTRWFAAHERTEGPPIESAGAAHIPPRWARSRPEA